MCLISIFAPSSMSHISVWCNRNYYWHLYDRCFVVVISFFLVWALFIAHHRLLFYINIYSKNFMHIYVKHSDILATQSSYLFKNKNTIRIILRKSVECFVCARIAKYRRLVWFGRNLNWIVVKSLYIFEYNSSFSPRSNVQPKNDDDDYYYFIYSCFASIFIQIGKISI